MFVIDSKEARAFLAEGRHLYMICSLWIDIVPPKEDKKMNNFKNQGRSFSTVSWKQRFSENLLGILFTNLFLALYSICCRLQIDSFLNPVAVEAFWVTMSEPQTIKDSCCCLMLLPFSTLITGCKEDIRCFRVSLFRVCLFSLLNTVKSAAIHQRTKQRTFSHFKTERVL